MLVKMENVAGIIQECTVTCHDCLIKSGLPENCVQEEILTEEAIQNSEDYYFCDVCGQQL